MYALQGQQWTIYGILYQIVATMHDPGSFDAAYPGQVSLAVVKEGIDEGAIRVACGRMDDQTHRLVDDQEVFVFMEDIERNVLCDKGRWLGVRNLDGDGVTGCDGGPRSRPAPIQKDVAILEKSLDAGAGELREFPGEEQIEPFPVVLLDGDGHG